MPKKTSAGFYCQVFPQGWLCEEVKGFLYTLSKQQPAHSESGLDLSSSVSCRIIIDSYVLKI